MYYDWEDESENWDLQDEEENPEDLYSDETTGQRKTTLKREDRDYINNRDYSLNSPLIRDQLDSLYQFVRGQSIVRYNQQADWKDIKGLIKGQSWLLETNWSERFHSWWTRSYENPWADTAEIDAFIRKVNKDAQVTGEVVRAFFDSWIGKDIPILPKENLPPWVQTQGALFLITHKLTLFMNSRTVRERESLINTFGGKLREDTDEWAIDISHSHWGLLTVSRDHVIFWRDQIILDLNLILLMKDTAIGRFNTYLTLIQRQDRRYSVQDLNAVREFYRLGDNITRGEGNDAYRQLKWIEPVCVTRLSMLAKEFKPLLQLPDDFERFVLDEINGMPNGRGLRDFANLILQTDSIDLVLVFFSSFRHFGHPFLDYIAGLDKLHEQVTRVKVIDLAYADALGSDLAFKILRSQYKKTKTWSLHKDQVHRIPEKLRKHVLDETWPTDTVIEELGDVWNKLPLKKCYDIPDLIDPAILYGDKSHSVNRSVLLQHLTRYPGKPIPTKRVITSFISRPATNWPEFLAEINESGLTEDDLIIGLRGKEREMKVDGRFFALMSWRLREYFVITEYLIKRHYVPLFSGLTMADDQTSVTKKMLQATAQQGTEGYSRISISSHLDYEKWNNHQRAESTDPVFEVMGHFLGYANLFTRTHEFFQKSFVYYVGRSDLLTTRGNRIVNSTGARVCWDGQDGGLEGLRQKGWSILNLLMIEREKKIRNTKVTVMAQGDNQVITTHYRAEVTPDMTDDAIRGSMQTLVENTRVIIRAIRSGAARLGLIIKEEETLQSFNLHIYGKVVSLNGCVLGLETKRTSRITSATNDQIPSLGSVMASATTNVLTVSHYDSSPVDPILMFNFFGNMTRRVVELHSPALRAPMYGVSKTDPLLESREYKWASLFLDPTLGGISGCSLTRFLMRLFPDPLTESLSFWKKIHEGTSSSALREFAKVVGNPRLKHYVESDFPKLLENPSGLNLVHSISAQTILKEEVKRHMRENGSSFKNEIIRDATVYSTTNTDTLNLFLARVEPCFPRFASEFKSATYLGIADSLVGLYQNSRTVRNLFSARMGRELDAKILQGERSNIRFLTSLRERTGGIMWDCSATRADELRTKSWGRKLVGTTVPHPFEMINFHHTRPTNCPETTSAVSECDYVTVHLPYGLFDYRMRRGPLPAYLGSKTSESTDILKPWEKETNIPLLKRAAKLREAIAWFIEPESNLANSIIQNLNALTGDEWVEDLKGFRRTGSAIHRFYCQRVSPGGYASTNPSRLTYMFSTTDTLSNIGSTNYDFMFQSLILYSQVTSGEIHDGERKEIIDHYHISCSGCLRSIEEVMLDSPYIYNPPDVSNRIKKWIPEEHVDAPLQPRPDLIEGPWENVPYFEKCRVVGVIQGFILAELLQFSRSEASDPALFPLGLSQKLYGPTYLMGLIEGLARSASLAMLQRTSVNKVPDPYKTLQTLLLHLARGLSQNPGFCNMCRGGSLRESLMARAHSIPAQYPIQADSVNSLCAAFVHSQLSGLRDMLKNRSTERLWVFSDLLVRGVMGPFLLSGEPLSFCLKSTWTNTDKQRLRALRDTLLGLRSSESGDLPPPELTRKARKAGVQIRAAITENLNLLPEPEPLLWGPEISGMVFQHTVTIAEDLGDTRKTALSYPARIQCPLISGLRLAQLATGSHYKIRSILQAFNIRCRDALIGGDGSGGISALILRYYPSSRVVFNSLLSPEHLDLRGGSPGPPSAVDAMGRGKLRCVNLRTAWEENSNLEEEATWIQFKKHKARYRLQFSLLIFDAEFPSGHSTRFIKLLTDHVGDLLELDGTLMVKSYDQALEKHGETILLPLARIFSSIRLVQTQFTSSFSGEYYIVCQGKLHKRRPRGVIDWNKVHEALLASFSRQSDTDELFRAQVLYNLDKYQGIPLSLVPPLELEIFHLLKRLDFPLSITSTLSKLLIDSKTKWVPITQLMVGCISHYHFGAGYARKEVTPPSLVSVRATAGALLGILYISAIRTGDDNLFRSANSMIATNLPIHWVRLDVDKWGRRVRDQSKTGWLLGSWNLSGKGLSRGVYLKGEMSVLGRWIRVLSRVSKIQGKGNENPEEIRLEESVKFDIRSAIRWSPYKELMNGSIKLVSAAIQVTSGEEVPRSEGFRD
ncbi:RNA dependent RNA polymerase [Caligus rogercresseyi rhabdovirus]|uniref:Replicase n=1 Tax=Caligus rogercresseyi rhabdovirus TaxID=1921414 RepID=A0A1L2YZU2_9RHAB|nr:RNA dependent RNA polymerase [Caligus rogercresseyi rhabdovirus]APF32078.1 RNA dependent RNA polymerase [Caligus rogercresseyi rhabdovirus]